MTGRPDTGREAITRSARTAFTKRPYAEVTIRGIAADAGVSPALVVKHFGSKERLFNSVADFSPAAERLLTAPLGELGRHMVTTIVNARRGHKLDPLLRVVFSLGNTDERTIIRERFRAQVTRRLAQRLTGPHRDLRAELITGQLLGFSATLSVHQPDGATAQATVEQLADLYSPSLQALITPDAT